MTAPDDVRKAICHCIALQLAAIMSSATGSINGYGLTGREIAWLRSSLKSIEDGLAGASFELVRPDVLSAIFKLARDRETAEKAKAVWNDDEYCGFRSNLLPRPGWKGNKTSRAEVDELYKPGPSGQGNGAQGARD